MRSPTCAVVVFQAATGTEFKGQTYTSADSAYPPNNRVYLNVHGVRINVVQAGAEGRGAGPAARRAAGSRGVWRGGGGSRAEVLCANNKRRGRGNAINKGARDTWTR